jgi:hypothetical protein
MARDRHQEFSKVPGAVAKRVGSLVAVTVAPPDLDAAERILAKIRYETNLTWNEQVPQNPAKGVAKLILDIMVFSGIVLLLCLAAGIGFGGTRIIARRFGWKEESTKMITLHLTNK